MASLAAVDTTVNNRTYNYTEKDAFDALYQELVKGVQSMKNGEVYTIEEAWEEIDKIQCMDKPKKYNKQVTLRQSHYDNSVAIFAGGFGILYLTPGKSNVAHWYLRI